jgi:hypothetical protein
MLTMRSGRGLIFTCLLATCLASFGVGSAVGQTLWPQNGHYYLIVNQTTTWQQARLLAEAMAFMGVPGHLATITSEDENTFVTTQLGDTVGAWLGGEQLPGSLEPAGGWQWITGEPWVYTNWDAGEPNNTYGGGWGKDATGQSEESLHYHHNGTHWNDLPDDPEVVTPRFIVEWDVPQGACIVPPSGMTGWWPGDGDTDDIVDGRNAVLRDDASFGPGLVDQAFSLDGDGDFVDVPHDPALNVGTGDFTVDLWVNFNDTAGEQVLVEKWIQTFACPLGKGPEGWSFTKLEGNILHMALFSADCSGELVFSEVLTIPLGTWHHFAARRQSGEITLFMNGAPVASGEFSGNLDSTSSLKFGHRGSPSDTPGSEDERGFFLNGRIDEVELFVGRALSDTEIQAIFDAGSAGKCKDGAAIEVLIDIKPGSFPNSINLKSKGVIPVAILTTAAFDATTVAPLSVKFGPAGATEAHGKGHVEDVNGDGKPDLVLHFRTQETGIQCGDTSASLTGETFEGDPIQGTDTIKTVGCR